MFRLVAVIALCCAGPALAEMQFKTATYRCERGVAIPVAYLTFEPDSAVVINVEGRQITLIREPAASGARYAWPSDGSGYVWWDKGDEATLSWFDAEHSEEVTLYRECRAE